MLNEALNINIFKLFYLKIQQDNIFFIIAKSKFKNAKIRIKTKMHIIYLYRLQLPFFIYKTSAFGSSHL